MDGLIAKNEALARELEVLRALVVEWAPMIRSRRVR